jgi:hypothetical protein
VKGTPKTKLVKSLEKLFSMGIPAKIKEKIKESLIKNPNNS